MSEYDAELINAINEVEPDDYTDLTHEELVELAYNLGVGPYVK